MSRRYDPRPASRRGPRTRTRHRSDLAPTVSRSRYDARGPRPGRVTAKQRRARPSFVSIFAAVFFFVPALAFAAGVRPGAIENRQLAEFPGTPLSWSSVDSLGAWVNDHLPLRRRGALADPMPPLSLFDEAPARSSKASRGPTDNVAAPSAARSSAEPALTSSPDVLMGKNNWLFLTDEFTRECLPAQPRAQVIAGLRRLQDILSRSGRRFVFTLAPSKSTIEPTRVPSDNPFAACWRKARDETWSMLDAAKIPGYINMKALIDQHQADEKKPYYFRKDSHWNGLATALLAQQVADRVSADAQPGTHVTESTVEYTGDLTQLLGVPAKDRSPTATIARTGVTVTIDPQPTNFGERASHSTATSTAASLVPGSTLLVGDSFAEAALPNLRPFFSDLVRVHTADIGVRGCGARADRGIPERGARLGGARRRLRRPRAASVVRPRLLRPRAQPASRRAARARSA